MEIGKRGSPECVTKTETMEFLSRGTCARILAARWCLRLRAATASESEISKEAMPTSHIWILTSHAKIFLCILLNNLLINQIVLILF